jgi:Tol biopolymer transport system component
MICGAERMAWSPDSKRLLTGGGDHRAADKPGELIVWDAATGKPVAKLDGHPRYVLAVAWSPDGRHFLSVDGNPYVEPMKSGAIILWNADTLTKEKTWTPPTGCLLDLAFDPRGPYAAAAGMDRNVYLLDPAEGKILRTLAGQEQSVTRLAFSRDGARLASGDAGGVVRLWETRSGQTERVLRVAANPIGGLCFNSRGDRLAAASFDFGYKDSGMIGLWDVSSGQEIIRLRGQQTVHFSPDDSRLAVAAPGAMTQPGAAWILDANSRAIPVTGTPGKRIGPE